MPPINLPLLGSASWSAHTNPITSKLCPFDSLLSLPIRRLEDLGEASFPEVPHPGHYWMHSTAITLIKLTMCVGGKGPCVSVCTGPVGFLRGVLYSWLLLHLFQCHLNPPRSAPQYKRCHFLCTKSPTKPNASGQMSPQPLGGGGCTLLCAQWRV